MQADDRGLYKQVTNIGQRKKMSWEEQGGKQRGEIQTHWLSGLYWLIIHN